MSSPYGSMKEYIKELNEDRLATLAAKLKGEA